jgi:hypothetical protein
MSRLPTFLFGAAAGATAAHFLDPDRGADRRSTVAGKAASAAGSGAATVSSNARYAAGKANGAARSVTPSPVKVEEEWADRLAAEARSVDGIKGVENLLHPPGTPAPGQG